MLTCLGMYREFNWKLNPDIGKLTDVTFQHILYIKYNLLHDSIWVGNDLLNIRYALFWSTGKPQSQLPMILLTRPLPCICFYNDNPTVLALWNWKVDCSQYAGWWWEKIKYPLESSAKSMELMCHHFNPGSSAQNTCLSISAPQN